MKKLLIALAMLFGGLWLSASPVQAGSCTFPVTDLSWSGTVNSGVHMRDKTCMDSNIVHTVSGGTAVSIIGEADGWYLIKLSDGTKGFVWNTFLTVTSKQSGEVTHKEVKVEEKKEHKVEKKTTTTKKHVKDATLSTRLKGHILLQVENNGEAWYVHPDHGKRFYMKDGDTAYEMMRSFGLGASNTDVDSLLAGDKALAERLSGKIVLAVQRHGEAYYINPSDLSVHYLQNGKEAYRVMRELSLGITNTDLEQIDSDAFSPLPPSSAKNSNPVAGSGEIALEAHQENGVIKLVWAVNGVDTSQGFKVVKSLDANPTYPNDNPVYLSDGSTRTYVKKGLTSGKTYNFRVCNYTGEGCGVYSNNVAVVVDGFTKDVESLDFSSGSIELFGDQIGSGIAFGWLVNGATTKKGFKFLTSLEPNPTYPEDDSVYLSDGDKRAYDKGGFVPGKTYYFRICTYTGEGCGVYSNDLVITFDEVPGSTVQAGIPAGVDLGVLNQYWLNEINALRADAGLRQLVLDSRWKETATEWATYMRDINSGTHNRPDGKSMHQWIDTKGLDFTVRHSEGGWVSNYFTENISWGIASKGTTEKVKMVLDDTLEFFLAEAPFNGDHYRTIYHEDWNSVGLGFAFQDQGNGTYKVFVAMHYGSLEL